MKGVVLILKLPRKVKRLIINLYVYELGIVPGSYFLI